MLREVSVLLESAKEISTSMEEISGGIKSIDSGAKGLSDLAAITRTSIQKISTIADGFEV
jgi:methyl-accepting chemotaxis protein